MELINSTINSTMELINSTMELTADDFDEAGSGNGCVVTDFWVVVGENFAVPGIVTRGRCRPRGCPFTPDPPVEDRRRRVRKRGSALPVPRRRSLHGSAIRI
ncbi:hypothetical protein ACWD1Y_45145 [Streptomyces sp. NPDC002814]